MEKLFPFLTYDYKIGGVDLRSFAQINGSTGTPVTNPYGAYSMCFNNPDYRRPTLNISRAWSPRALTAAEARACGAFQICTPQEGDGARATRDRQNTRDRDRCENEHVALTAYEVDGALAIHLVNLADAEKLPAIRLTVNCPLSVTPTRAVLRTPECSDELILPIENSGALSVSIPADVFAGYAMVALEA